MGPSCYQLTQKTHPNAPQNVTGVINGDGSITVNWDKVEGALAYLTHYGDANQGVTSGLKYIGYSETNSWTLAAKNVPNLEVGDFITVTIQAYHVAAPSYLTEKEKAEFLDKGTLPRSEWSDPVMLTKLKTHIAYANSADGTDGFTTVYPNLNLLTDSKDFKNKNVAEPLATTSITSPDSTIIKEGNDTYLNFIKSTKSQDWFRAYMIRGSSVSPNFQNVDVKPNSKYTFSVWLKGTGTHQIIAYDKWTIPNPTILTVELTDKWTKYVLTVNTATTILAQNAQFFIRSGNVGSEINLKYPKVEQGSTATPYMQSATEVTTADWPKYVGTYTDSSESQSENPGDYKWKLAYQKPQPDIATNVMAQVYGGVSAAEYDIQQ